MARSTQLPFLYILETAKKGRGVYTSEIIDKGTIIEICPVIVLSKSDTLKIHQTHLHDYYIVWEIDKGTSALALGYGSIYNHSEKPNSEMLIDLEERVIRFAAIQKIAPNEEITYNYIALEDTLYNLWFESK